MTLSDLVVRARAGDRTAYDGVVELCWGEIFAFTAARSVSLDEADEVTHSTFVEAWFALARYEEREIFPGWLKGIARNLLRRRRDVRATSGLDAVADLIAAQLDRDDGRSEDDAERVRRLQACLEQLPQHLRLLAQKRFGEDLPLSTLCQHLHRTRAAIANALTRLRVSLRDCVERQDLSA